MPEDGGGGYEAGSVFIGVEADTSPFFAELDALATRANRVPTVRVDFDHGPLTAGNQHTESKFTHVLDVNRRLAQNAITPKYEGSQVNRLTADLRAVQGQVTALQQQRIQLEASLNADSVRAEVDAIANQPRVIHYAATVQMPDLAALQGNVEATIKATIDPARLKSAAPEIGKIIADQVAKAKVDVNQGGILSRIAFSGISSIFRGFQESIGKEIFKGVSDGRKQSLQNVGGVVDRVTSAAGGAVRDTALKGAGFADVKDFQQAFKNFKLENLFLEPIQRASSVARAAAVQAKVEGENAAKAYFSVFRTTLVSEVKSSKDIKEAGLSALGRTVGAAANVSAPIQDFRRDVAIGKAKKQAESIDIQFTEQEIEAITKAKKQILVGNTGFYLSGQGNLGSGILGGPSRRFLGQEFVGVDNPQSTNFLRGDALPDPLKKVVDEPRTLSFFRNLAKAANRLGLDVPEILETIDDGAELESVLLGGLKSRSGDLRRFYLSAIENTFGAGVNADLAQQIAKVNAIKKLRPDLDVKGVGFSGGGYVVDQLSRATGIKSVALGTPFFRPPAAVSGRGQLDSIYASYGNSIVQNLQDQNIEDLRGVGKAHLPEKYFGKKNLREFVNTRLDLGLSNEAIQGQGVDFRSTGSLDKNIETITKALGSISIASGHLEDISSYVKTVDFASLSPEDIGATLKTVFDSIEANISGFEKAIGDPSIDNYQDQLTGVVDKYQSAIAAMIQQPEEIAETFQKYANEFQSIATEAVSVRASDIASPPEPKAVPPIATAAKESQALAEQVKTVTAEVVKTKNPIQKLRDNIVKAEAVTLDFLTLGRGAQTKQALQLTGGFKLREVGQSALAGTASALRGGYGLAQGVENAALGLTPFGVGFGAKKTLQAGVGFAALNAVAPSAGQFVLTAGNALGSTVGGGIGEAFTQYMIGHTPGFIAPIVQALGSGISSMLGGLGGSVGTGAALLGAGATTVAASEQLIGSGFKTIAPQPLQLALKEAKQAELVGIELTQKVTQAVLKGATQTAQAYLSPSVKVEAEISPITQAFNAIAPQPQLPAPRPSGDEFVGMTPRPKLGAKKSNISEDGSLLVAQRLKIVSQEARAEFLSLINNPAIKNGRIDLLYNAAIEAKVLISNAQRAKDQLRQLAYENKGTPIQQQLTGSMTPIVKNAKDAQNLLRELIKGYEKTGRDIGVFIQAGIASGLTPPESAAAAEKLVAVIQETIENGFEIASPSKWARRAGQFVVQGLSLGLNAKDAIAAANRLADGVVAATESGFGSRFKGIGNQFVLGLQDEIVQAQNKLTGGRRFFIKPFEGADNAVKFGAETTISEIKKSAAKIGIAVEIAASQYEIAQKGFRKRLFTTFQGDDNAVAFTPNTKIKQILDQAKAQGIEYERTVQKFELAGRGTGQTPSVQAKRFTQFQGKDDRIPFNGESRIGDVVLKAQSKGLYADGIEQPKYEIKGNGVQKKAFTETGYKYEPIEQDLEQNLSKVRKTKEQIREEAFATGQQYGERVGAGLKSAGKFVEAEAKKVGDRIPEGIKSGAGAGIESIKGFVSGLRTQFDIARREIPTLDLLGKGIKNIALLAGGGFIGFQAFQILTSQATESYEAIKKLEATKISLDISTKGQGAQVLDDIAKRADNAGGNLAQFRENYTQFAAALRDTPLEGQTRRLASGVDALGSGLQLPTEQVQRVRIQVTQIASKPNVQREDLITLSESLPGAFSLSARAIGVTNGELSKLLETGQLAGTDFIPKLANVINKDFSGSLINSSKSIQSAENRLASANLKFQELGQIAAPIAAAGLSTLAGILEFVTSNSNTLGTALRLSVLGGVTLLAKAAIPLIGNLALLSKEFLVYNGLITAAGVPTAKAGSAMLGLVKSLALGAIQFGAIALAAQIAVNALSLFGDKSGNVGEALKISRRELAEYENQLNRIGKKDSNRTELSKGTYKTFRELQSDTGQDIGKAQELKDRRKEQKSNFFSRANENILDLFQKGDFFYKNSLEKTISDRLDAANKQQSVIDKKIAEAKTLISNAGGDVANVNPVAFDATSDVLNKEISRLKTLQETAESIAEKNVYDKQLKQLEPLIKLFEKSALPTLNLARAFAALDVVNVRAETRIGNAESSNAIARGEGRINDFQSQSDTLKTTVEERQQQLQAAEAAFSQLKAYRASAEYASRVGSGQLDPTAQDKIFYGKEKEFYAARTQLGEALTKSRETQYNRRAELLQREITAQDSFRAKLEAITRVRVSTGQSRTAERQAKGTISPFQVQLEQSAITQAESADKVAQLNQKLINQRKGASQALENLQQVNPVDEQAYESAKAQYEGLRNSAISTQAEINDARKQGFDAVTQANQVYEEQIRTQLDLTARRAEQGLTKQQAATERLGNAQKRQIENSIAGLQRQQKFLDLAAAAIERAGKLSSKRAELNTALNQGAQIPLVGTIAAIRDAEGLIQKLKQKDLDPEVRGRTVGVLNQLGISDNEQEAFRYRVSEEEKLARLKAEGISAEIAQSQVTLDFEQRREEFASKRAVLAAQETVEAAKRSAIETQIERKKAENEVRRSRIGIDKATVQLDLAKQSGDPNKVREAQLNLQDAQLTAAGAQETLLGAQQTEKLAKDALPNATLSVVDALANFAATIEGGKLSRRILGAQNQNKVAQFGQEERGRVRGLAIEGIDKGVSVDINTGAAGGYDPFGFRASRAKDAAINQRERQQFQNNIRGISGRTTLPTVTPAAPIDTSKALGGNAQADIEKRLSESMPPVSTATLENQLSQLIALLGYANGTLVSISTKKPPVPPPTQIINQRVDSRSNGGLPR